GRTKHMNMKRTRAKSVGCVVVLQLVLVMVMGVQAQVRTKPSLFTGGEAQQFQELRCRGGAGLRFVVTDGRTPSSGDQTRIMIVNFQPAAQPADPSGRNLQPGQRSRGKGGLVRMRLAVVADVGDRFSVAGQRVSSCLIEP